MKQTRYITLLFFGTIFFAGGCGKNGCLKKAGPVKTIVRQLNSFSGILLHDKIDVILTQDSVQQVKIEAGENLLPDVETTVINNVLTVRDNSTCKWVRDLDEKITVYISSPALHQIIYHGAGNIKSTNTLKADEFTIDSPEGLGLINLQLESRQTNVIIRMNAADIILKGKSDRTSVYCAVSGSVNLRDFVSDYVTIDHRSVRDCWVNVVTTLDARILYKGNLYYKGNPPWIDTVYNSSGRMFRLP
jgi:hypothetical protein